MIAAVAAVTMVATPVLAASLNSKDRARVARADPRDRDDVRYCLLQGKKGRDKGTAIGAGVGAGASIIAGGGVGETVLAGAGGAAAGRLIGKGSGTNSRCDECAQGGVGRGGELVAHHGAEGGGGAGRGGLHPVGGGGDVAGVGQQPAMVELAAKIAALRRDAIAFRRAVHVAGEEAAFLMKGAEEIDRLGMAEGGGLLEPAERRLFILGYARAEAERAAPIIHAPVEARFGCAAIAGGGRDRIDRRAPALFMAAADHVDRHHMARGGGEAEVAEGFGRVGGDALTVEQQLAIIGLGVGQAGLRTGTDQRGGGLRRGSELRAHLVGGLGQEGRGGGHQGRSLAWILRLISRAGRRWKQGGNILGGPVRKGAPLSKFR
ncbi:hypothetical protein LTR94_014617 [Friedmanniomyces endolithicus]|nr:hypothetical protein LTR94_014617 [Friedmanniomyces endolithicus]